jgi:hypothetical protein
LNKVKQRMTKQLPRQQSAKQRRQCRTHRSHTTHQPHLLWVGLLLFSEKMPCKVETKQPCRANLFYNVHQSRPHKTEG